MFEILPPSIKLFTESWDFILSKQKYNMKIKIFLNVDLTQLRSESRNNAVSSLQLRLHLILKLAENRLEHLWSTLCTASLEGALTYLFVILFLILLFWKSSYLISMVTDEWLQVKWEMFFKLLPYFLNTWRANSWLRAFSRCLLMGRIIWTIIERKAHICFCRIEN